MTTKNNLSAREVAQAYVGAKTAAARKKVLVALEERMAGDNAPKRKRWAELLTAMQTGDNDFVVAVATGAKAKTALKVARKSEDEPKPKASKPARKTKAKPANDAPDVGAIAKTLGVPEELLAALVTVASK